jgi:hypothetical protein
MTHLTVISSERCRVCYHLDPRGHPFANTFVVEGRIVSAVQLQFPDLSMENESEERCGYCRLMREAWRAFFSVKDDAIGSCA